MSCGCRAPTPSRSYRGNSARTSPGWPWARRLGPFSCHLRGGSTRGCEARRGADDEVELFVDRGWGEAVEARLRRFLLRTKAEIERGTVAGDVLDEAARIESGVPAMGAEIDERTIPAETGWVDASVSFTKGCFVGQELVARMDSRTAEPPRRLVRLCVEAPVDAAVGKGDPIESQGNAVGEITSAAWSEPAQNLVALGYVKRGTDLAAPVSVAGHPARIQGPAGA